MRKKKLEEAEEVKGKNLKKAIARLAVILGSRAMTATKDRLPKINTAILLLNQASSVANSNPDEARKLLALARRIKASGDVAESNYKKSRKELHKAINEKRKNIRVVKCVNS